MRAEIETLKQSIIELRGEIASLKATVAGLEPAPDSDGD
jgi:hypothetical protein